MAGLHDLRAPLPQNLEGLQVPPPTAAGWRKSLTNLQGNILKGHGRNQAIHMFLQFKAGKQQDVKTWISTLARSITSAQQQLEEGKQYRAHHIPGRLFVSFFLSANGYNYFGLDLEKFGPDQQAFRHGMKAASHRLNDPFQETWDEEYRQDIHAMILLADNDEHHLLWEAHRRIEEIKESAAVLAVEHGRTMRNMCGDSIEHFGYADSLSQPLFFQQGTDRLGESEHRANLSDAFAGPDLVLVPDPYGEEQDANMGETLHHSGSYLVFRKLEQYVRAYKDMEQNLANALGLTGEDAKRAGALVVGRFEDGTPVVLQPTAGRKTNNFDYAGDPDGEKCPVQAHIRKVNPRQSGVPRIVRRGIPYGQRWKEPKDNPTLEELPLKDVGLLFMCYQSNIEKQFEILQYFWASDPRHPQAQKPGIDPLVGQPGALGTGQHRWPAQWNDPRARHKPVDLRSFVKLKGGEYFFAPSIYFLENIHAY